MGRRTAAPRLTALHPEAPPEMLRRDDHQVRPRPGDSDVEQRRELLLSNAPIDPGLYR